MIRLGKAGMLFGALVAVAGACSNDPYPSADAQEKVLYGSFVEPPKKLDPATSYSANEHIYTGAIYATLLEYHFLKRPLELIPSLATSLPEVVDLANGRTRYRFELRPDLLFHEDACFELASDGRRTRLITMADIAFQLMRIADPKVSSPVTDPFSHIEGFQDFTKRLAERRAADVAFAAQPVHEQYAEVGPIAGVATPSSHVLEITLATPYPQILYWFAMQFTTPVPWEAIAYYDGQEGRDRFDDHPVGSGPYQITRYDKRAIIVLERSASWHGVRHPEWQAPGTVYPSEGEPEDREQGLLDDAGRPLPMIDRIEVRREKESISRFTKFMQGYYDTSTIAVDNFDMAIRNDALSPEMAAVGIRLEKDVAPVISYVAFNMNDPVVGRGNTNAEQDRNRRLRQAMSLVIDSQEFLRIFANGRGLAAQSPIPPNIYGYEADYRNPFRTPDLDRAKVLMTEAGYPGGIDPKTGDALRITLDSANTTTQGLIQLQFFKNAWKKLGLDVRIDATNYNQFQEKLRNGAHQVFDFGWVADYPDPENFLFLLSSKMGNDAFGGPNAANFSDSRFDALFDRMKVEPNGPHRMEQIRAMRGILERERPWIELFFPENYSLLHGWVSNVKSTGMSIPTYQYMDIDPALRAERRRAWNDPIVWPAWVLAAVAFAVLVPGIRTYLRERQ